MTNNTDVMNDENITTNLVQEDFVQKNGYISREINCKTINYRNDMTDKEMGAFIKQEREKMHLTQKQLADKVGVSERTIQNLEAASSMKDKNVNIVLNHFGFRLTKGITPIIHEKNFQ